jgi:predicted nucleic acid-binding protein
VILVDTSAWVEFLRGTGSSTDERVDALLGEEASLTTTDVVLMEVLAGARDDAHRDQLRRLLAGCTFIATEGPRDYEDAAALYRSCRKGGETIRALTDCLIAAVAVRADVPVLHADSDFEAIARHTPLTIA